MATQDEAQRPLAKRVLSDVGMTLASAALLCLFAGVLYGGWSYQTWQYEWATGCQPDHGGLSKVDWFIGVRPWDDCRPWWARLIFRDH